MVKDKRRQLRSESTSAIFGDKHQLVASSHKTTAYIVDIRKMPTALYKMRWDGRRATHTNLWQTKVDALSKLQRIKQSQSTAKMTERAGCWWEGSMLHVRLCLFTWYG
ncbi:unnamed protein product [Ceratitis capitata]|uniref:(Mediterranean fruit fly) hypothetical protein n=1 Tax=Ceratitis capitata TaxID=7213 RepID=A0A811UVY9_CERCA|nr:unnamed protein product [Ceratitis capitata]